MRVISPQLEAHFGGGLTTLATCWRLTRQDGAELGFTDLDRTLVIDTLEYDSIAGFTPTTVESKSNMSVDNLDLEGQTFPSKITESDLLAGMYDYAEVEIFLVNYEDLSQGKLVVKRGRLGEVTLNAQMFHAEVRGLLSEGEAELAFEELNKLHWIKEVPNDERNQQIADAYLSATTERKRGGEFKTALIVSPTHAEGAVVTAAIRDGLKAKGKLKNEHVVTSWVSARLTDAQKTDATEYSPGDMVQFQQNAKGFTKGSRLVIKDGELPPLELAKRFELYRSQQIALASGDRIRVTAGGMTKDGKHRLSNGALLAVKGFTERGDITLHVAGGKIQIKGRNLNTEIRPNVRLFQGLTRHRVPWIQEADNATRMESGGKGILVESIEW